MKKHVLLTLLAYFGTSALFAAAPLTEVEWAALRRAALERPRRLIVNNDGCDVTGFPKGVPVTEQNVCRVMLDKLEGVPVDTVSYVPYAVGHVLSTRSKVTEVYTEELNPNAHNAAPDLFALGTDPLEIAVRFCRKRKIEIWAGMRVNDIHDHWEPLLSEMKKQHPEWLVGTREKRPLYGRWTAFDFAVPETRKRFRAIVKELLANYDVDGIELDFYRYPVFFKSVAWGGRASRTEIAMMTQMMRDVRHDADEIGKKKGRYLLIAARLPDSPALGVEMGIDFGNWMKEKLIDVWIPGSDLSRFTTYADAAAVARKYGILCYSPVDVSFSRTAGHFNRKEIGAYFAQYAAARRSGGNGVYCFNMFYATPFLYRLGDPAERSKRYFAEYHNVNTFCRRQDEFNALRTVNARRLPPTPGGKPVTVMMELGEEFRKGQKGPSPRVTLYVKVKAKSAPELKASVNGRMLGKARPAGGDFAFAVPPSALKPGKNFFRLTAAAEMTLEDAALNVFYEPQLPAPLARAAALPQPETIQADAAKGAGAFALFRSTYRDSFAVFRNGVLHLNHMDSKKPFSHYFYAGELVQQRRGVLSLAWRVKPGAPYRREKGEGSFAVSLKAPAGVDMVYDAYFRFAPDGVESPFGRYEVEPEGWHTWRLLLDLASGETALLMDGRPVLAGRAGKVMGRSEMSFGDGSRFVTGSAELRFVKFGILGVTENEKE